MEEIIKELENIQKLIKKSIDLYKLNKKPEEKKAIANYIRNFFDILSKADEEILIFYALMLFDYNDNKTDYNYVVWGGKMIITIGLKKALEMLIKRELKGENWHSVEFEITNNDIRFYNLDEYQEKIIKRWFGAD